jgi:hypothetical protein
MSDEKEKLDKDAGFQQGSAAAKADRKLPENSKENLDKKLDNAIEETFPTSDPISVNITK